MARVPPASVWMPAFLLENFRMLVIDKQTKPRIQPSHVQNNCNQKLFFEPFQNICFKSNNTAGRGLTLPRVSDH
jgi:hypothetical protein